KLQQVHQIQFAQQAKTIGARRVRVKGQRPFDAIAFQKVAALQDLLEKFAGQILALKQQAKGFFIQRRIIERGLELAGWRFLNQTNELVAGSRHKATRQRAHRDAPSLLRLRSAIRAAVSAGRSVMRLQWAFGKAACSSRCSTWSKKTE